MPATLARRHKSGSERATLGRRPTGYRGQVDAPTNQLALPSAENLGGRTLTLPVAFRVLLGAGLGTVPFVISIWMAPSHRSPYLLAYPAVILSAWMLGVAGSVTCAAVCGLLIEHFIFGTHQIELSPTNDGWIFREAIFIIGSLIAGLLTRTFATHQQRVSTARLKERLALAAAQQTAAEERERAAELSRENEGRVQLALEGANVGLWEWDIETSQSKWSSGFYRLHGLSAGGPSNYAVWRSAVHPEDIERVEAALADSLKDGSPFAAEYRVILPNNELRWLTCQANPVVEGGTPRRMIGYAGDVTRRKLADLALLETEKLAVAGRLSASIAHEVVNPLEAAMNLIYLAETTEDAPERQQYLQDSVQQLLRVAQITKQTLKFSRTRDSVLLCSGTELLHNVLDLLLPKFRLGKIDYHEQIQSDAEFLCSAGEMQQILTNILNNAAEAMPPGGGRISVRVRQSQRWGRQSEPGLRFTIGDNGSGMPKHVRERLREPFFTTKEGTGTGLGMWIVSELIERHRGTLTIRSSNQPERHGTVMSIFIPFTSERTGSAPPA